MISPDRLRCQGWHNAAHPCPAGSFLKAKIPHRSPLWERDVVFTFYFMIKQSRTGRKGAKMKLETLISVSYSIFSAMAMIRSEPTQVISPMTEAVRYPDMALADRVIAASYRSTAPAEKQRRFPVWKAIIRARCRRSAPWRTAFDGTPARPPEGTHDSHCAHAEKDAYR